MWPDPENFSTKADPVKDPAVFMIVTQYHGQEEFEIDGEKRSAHRFGAIDLIEGRWSEDRPLGVLGGMTLQQTLELLKDINLPQVISQAETDWSGKALHPALGYHPLGAASQ